MQVTSPSWTASRGARATTLALVAALAPMTPACGTAQRRIPRSQRGAVEQTIAATTIRVTYGRPAARGREIFGALVPWGRVWTPGADSATAIETSTNLTVAGNVLPAGRYSIWTIPGPERWTIIFSRRDRAFHTRYPGETNDALRFDVTPHPGPDTETLTWEFPVATGRRGMLALRWARTVVEIPLEAPPP